MTTIDALIEKLEERYPNDIFELEKLTEKERDAYIVKLNLIAEIKTIDEGDEDEAE